MASMDTDDLAHRGAPAMEERVAALAAGLRRLRLPESGTALVVVCVDHEDDRVVAGRAASRAGLRPAHVEPSSSSLRSALTDRPAVVLACAEGSLAVADSRIPCRIFRDRVGMAWWRMLEMTS